ncbi:HNH endonuclease [Paenibacillus puldeungensis]|uniref:HNH endonuclease n=1 Tax=Paenibacillus puldeungensis TaxID=696536 RepID=A0ABW3RY26_9BACL
MKQKQPSTNLPDSPSPINAKKCAYCGEVKPLTDFLKRTGKRAGKGSRRGACRSCRTLKKQDAALLAGHANTISVLGKVLQSPLPTTLGEAPKRRIKQALPAPPPTVSGSDAQVLRPNRNGMIRMRGRTDKGRRWQQEVELELAVTLVREYAAVVVNPYTIRRLYTNKAFRSYILTRDKHTCFFCGEYGDTIDHLLPKAKGGHTTPMNCVCACNLCNQSKADRSLEDFMENSGS